MEMGRGAGDCPIWRFFDPLPRLLKPGTLPDPSAIKRTAHSPSCRPHSWKPRREAGIQKSKHHGSRAPDLLNRISQQTGERSQGIVRLPYALSSFLAFPPSCLSLLAFLLSYPLSHQPQKEAGLGSGIQDPVTVDNSESPPLWITHQPGRIRGSPAKMGNLSRPYCHYCHCELIVRIVAVSSLFGSDGQKVVCLV